MKALVTGGAGFIGSTLVDRLLEEGHRVDVVDDLSTGSLDNLVVARTNKAFQLFELDICDPSLGELLLDRSPEVVFHLAAQASVARSVADPAFDAKVNIQGSLSVLDAARTAGARKIVFAASGGTLYGSAEPSELPLSEAHAQAPSSPYGISKHAVVDYLRAYRDLYRLEFTALALANVYGPRQDPFGEAGVVAIFAANIVAGLESTIFGDGEQTRDFVYVDDVVSAFVAASTLGDGALVNIGTGAQTSVNTLYEAMAKNDPGAAPCVHGPAREGDVRFSALDPTLAAELLGWRGEIPLREGVARVISAASKRRG